MKREEPTRGDSSHPEPGASDPAVIKPRSQRPRITSKRAAPPAETPLVSAAVGSSRGTPGPNAGLAGTLTDDPEPDPSLGMLIQTVVSPFHCLYQDALHFHTQSRLAQSEADASRQARAAFLLYMTSIQALARQAAEELGRGEARTLVTDPAHPVSLLDVWRALPGLTAPAGPRRHDPQAPPWPQLAELVALHDSWTHPGSVAERVAYYRARSAGDDFEPLDPRTVPEALDRLVDYRRLIYPRTGLPRDPYALRPRHLDTVRSVLDAAIETLDNQMEGALLRGQRHRLEPVRVLYPPVDAPTQAQPK